VDEIAMSNEMEWSPTPETLAAYEDGEYEEIGQAGMKTRVEAWLLQHPEAAAELADHRRLRHLWNAAAPAEPDADTWAALLARIEAAPRTARHSRWGRGLGWIAGLLVVGAAALFVVATGMLNPGPAQPDVDSEPFIVATAEEVEILSVAGADTQTLVVGQLPVGGPLELLQQGEVTVTSVAPAAHDNMVPQMRDRPPMIWARLETDVDD
jgi:anti-sigma factor RsiW